MGLKHRYYKSVSQPLV